MNIDGFKGSFSDLARPNRFRVSLARAGNLEFLCKATGIPAVSAPAGDAPFMGRNIKIPGDQEQEDWSITVYASTDMTEYNLMKDWVEQSNSPQANTGLNPEAVKEDGRIFLLNRQGGTIREWTIVGAMPTEVGTLDMSWDPSPDPLEFECTLAYDYIQAG